MQTANSHEVQVCPKGQGAGWYAVDLHRHLTMPAAERNTRGRSQYCDSTQTSATGERASAAYSQLCRCTCNEIHRMCSMQGRVRDSLYHQGFRLGPNMLTSAVALASVS